MSRHYKVNKSTIEVICQHKRTIFHWRIFMESNLFLKWIQGNHRIICSDQAINTSTSRQGIHQAWAALLLYITKNLHLNCAASPVRIMAYGFWRNFAAFLAFLPLYSLAQDCVGSCRCSSFAVQGQKHKETIVNCSSLSLSTVPTIPSETTQL